MVAPLPILLDSHKIMHVFRCETHMRIRCPNCGELIRPTRSGCPYCGYPEDTPFPETFIRPRDDERDMELYDDLFDAHSKLADQGCLD